jgi:hypothetical protein
MAELEALIWAGDVDALCRAAPCICCCADHYFDHCPARRWGGCRGQGSPTRAERDADLESWIRHYADRMTRAEFLGIVDQDEHPHSY